MIPPPRQGGGGTKAPALTYVVALGGVVVHVVVSVAGGFVVKCSLVSALLLERSLALSFGLGQPRDSTFSNHGSEFVQSASSSTFSLCEILGRIDDSSIVLALSLVSLVSHVSENPRAPSLHLLATPVRPDLFSMRSMLILSEKCLSISPIRSFTLLNDSLSVTS